MSLYMASMAYSLVWQEYGSYPCLPTCITVRLWTSAIRTVSYYC